MGQLCAAASTVPLSVKLHTVKSVEDDGFTVMLETPLAYTHFGITESFEDGQFIDIRSVFSIYASSFSVQSVDACLPFVIAELK